MKFTLDTNLYRDGIRREQAQAEIFGFFARALPFLHLGAIVMQELAGGARSADAARDVERGIFDPFVRRGRVFTPSSAAFADSGRVLRRWPHVKAGRGLPVENLFLRQ